MLRYAARRPVFVTTYTPDESVSVRVRGENPRVSSNLPPVAERPLAVIPA